MSDSKAEYPEVLICLRGHVLSVIQDRGIVPDIAAQVADEVVERLADDWGGSLVYIPKALRFKSQERAAEILARFNGKNKNELCREYGISFNSFYRILRLARSHKRGASESART